MDTTIFPLVGVVHLKPLPGAPRSNLTMDQILAAAIQDAVAYRDGGASAIIVENFGDAPFTSGRVEPHVVAALTLAVAATREAVALPVGINVLRNDALAAMGIAAITGASFIRVNIHTGVMVTDQGIIEGRADETLRYRMRLDRHVQVWADVQVKHGTPLGQQDIEDAAEDAVIRGLADAIIVTGRATGKAADLADLQRVRRALPRTPIYIGSGVSPAAISASLPAASGFIVGTWAKVDGNVENPVDPERVMQLVRAIENAAPSSPHNRLPHR